jgi:hypothetical protein
MQNMQLLEIDLGRTHRRLWAGVLLAVSLQPVEEGLAASFDLIGDPVYFFELKGEVLEIGGAPQSI